MVKYEIPVETHVTTTVPNILGAEIARIVDRKQAAGYYEYVFNSKI